MIGSFIRYTRTENNVDVTRDAVIVAIDAPRRSPERWEALVVLATGEMRTIDLGDERVRLELKEPNVAWQRADEARRNVEAENVQLGERLVEVTHQVTMLEEQLASAEGGEHGPMKQIVEELTSMIPDKIASRLVDLISLASETIMGDGTTVSVLDFVIASSPGLAKRLKKKASKMGALLEDK